MEADKYQDLQLANWRPRGADLVSSIWNLAGLTHRKSWCFSWIWREEKSWCSSSKVVRQGLFPLNQTFFYPGPQLIGWGPPTLGRAIYFTQSTDSNVISSKNIFVDTPRIMFDHTPCGPFKLTRTMNHHTYSCFKTQPKHKPCSKASSCRDYRDLHVCVLF